MKDCGCKKENASGNWMGDEEVGDEFLFEEGTNMIKSIERNLNSSQINKKAIFNIKLDEDQLSMLVLDDTVIDYSYIDEDDDTMINYEVQDNGGEGEEGETEGEEEEYQEDELNEDSESDNDVIIKETEEPVEDDTQYQEEKKYSSKREAVKYLKDLL